MKKIWIFFLILYSVSGYSQEREIVLQESSIFGGLQARHIGPALMSGRIVDIETHPTSHRILYIGAAGGGVWKSVNGGSSFQPIFDKYAQSIGKIKLDPKNPDQVIWVGTGEIWTRNSVSIGDGLYQTKDGGITWAKKGFENSERISSIEIHPEHTDTIYVGVLGPLWSDSESRGLFKSTDGGNTWSKILYLDKKTGCTDIIMDPKNPDILYVSMWEFRRTAWSFNSGGLQSGLFKTTNGGQTWIKIHKGFPKGKLGRLAVAIAPSNNNILYACIESEDKLKSGLYKSIDAGENWEHLNKNFGLVVRPFYFSRIVVNPQDPEVVVKSGLFGSISRDGGKTFKNLGYMHPDIHDIAFDNKNQDRMYVATDGGLYRSWDGGVTMEIVANLPLSQFYHVSVDNEDPYHVYGGLQDNGSWYGPSSSPGGIEARDWKRVGVGDGFRVLRHAEKKIIYSEMQGAENVWRYDMERHTLKSIQPLQVKGLENLRFNWNAPMALSQKYTDRLYMGSQYLHISEDLGNTWKVISPDLTTNNTSKQNQAESGGISKDNSGAENHCTIFTIAESPLNSEIIWVGTDDGNIQVTQNGGKTWVNNTPNLKNIPPNTWVYHMEASTHNEGTAYAVLDGHTTGDMNTYVLKTENYGKDWINIATSEINGFARSLQEDYENKDLLFLGTEFGLFVTFNGGKNWVQFTNNMPATAVHFIDLQKSTNDLVLGTHGRGVIIIDDISPLRTLTQEVLAKKVHFFETRPTVMNESSSWGSTATEREFVGSNPTQHAKIIYYLKKRHIFGKMNIEIRDMNGKKLIDITPKKTKGINLVTWNGRIKQPKIAKGNSLTFGGFTSPRVPAGTYQVVMTKGKDTFNTTLTYISDANSPITAAERKANHIITMKLYDLSQELAYMVYELDEIVSKAKSLHKNGGEKVAKPILDALATLKESLVTTTGDNYVDSEEPKLRGKIAKLYSKIAVSFQAPTNTEKKNLQLLSDEFKIAKKDFEDIKSKLVSNMKKVMEEKNMAPISLNTFEQFINK